jgi:hypothetical protein
MNWIILLQLLPLIISLIKIAESILGDRTGTKKKAFVVDGIEQIMKAMPSVSTGAQKKSWEAINNAMPAIKDLVDVLAGIFFSKKG